MLQLWQVKAASAHLLSCLRRKPFLGWLRGPPRYAPTPGDLARVPELAPPLLCAFNLATLLTFVPGGVVGRCAAPAACFKPAGRDILPGASKRLFFRTGRQTATVPGQLHAWKTLRSRGPFIQATVFLKGGRATIPLPYR